MVNGCQGPDLPEPTTDSAQMRVASDWPEYGGGNGQRFAAQSQITPDNVSDLEVAWTYRTGDVTDGSDTYGTGSAFENTPLLVDGMLYLCTPFNRVIALDPQTGAEHWSYDPKIDLTSNYANQFVCRGVSSWKSAAENDQPCAQTIFTATNDARLIALDAKTGEICTGFGEAGQVALHEGVGETAWAGEYQHTSPPLVIGDLVVVGGSVSDNSRINPPSGVVRAYDARSGAPVWAFDLAPPGFDYETGMTSDAGYALGTPNVWAPMVADAKLGLVYIPTGNPSPDYYRETGNRLDHYGSSVVALSVASGEVIWSYQTVHHDLWDFDVPAQPTLIDIDREGTIIPALVQATKMGLLFVLNRETGEPVFPVEERAVPQPNIPGLLVSPTQPFPTLPKPLANIDLKAEDAWGLTFLDKRACRKAIAELRFDGMYTVANEEWTLMYPGNAGGSNWGGVAVHPDKDIVIANVMDLAWKARLIPRAEATAMEGKDAHGEMMAMRGYPYAGQRDMLMSPLGIPCSPPPWGKLVAIDLKTGERLWDVPLGTIRDIAPVPINWKLGVPNLGGPMVTEGGLVFIGAAVDDYLRAFDLGSGTELWKARLPAGGQATPMSYSVTQEDGSQKQFVVMAAGGHGSAGTTLGDYVIAYSIP
jgi:quinoprotein glucose dehydrogenase